MCYPGRPVPPGDHHPLCRLCEVGQRVLAADRPHERAYRHLDGQIGAGGAVLSLLVSASARNSLVVTPTPQRPQGVEARVRHQIHAAAAPAVAAIGAAARHVLLAPKMHGAVSTIAGLDPQPGLVAEHVGSLLARAPLSIRGASRGRGGGQTARREQPGKSERGERLLAPLPTAAPLPRSTPVPDDGSGQPASTEGFRNRMRRVGSPEDAPHLVQQLFNLRAGDFQPRSYVAGRPSGGSLRQHRPTAARSGLGVRLPALSSRSWRDTPFSAQIVALAETHRLRDMCWLP